MKSINVSKLLYLSVKLSTTIIRRQCSNLTQKTGAMKIQKRSSSNYYMEYSVPNDLSFLIKQDTVSHDKQNLMIHWDQDREANRFHALWLRHQCHCEECITHSSGQRILNPENIQIPLQIEDAVMKDNSVHLRWSNDGNILHKGHIPLQWLHLNRTSYFEGQVQERFKLHEFDFREVIDSEEGLYKYLYSLNQNGAVKVVNAPRKNGGSELAEAISFIFRSKFGTTFEVSVRPNPEHAAYLDVALMQHSDSVFVEQQPGLQHLHCVELSGSVTGGILTLKDIYLIAEEFRRKHSEEFEALAKTPVQFNFILFRDSTYLLKESTHFKLDLNGDIEYIRWGPSSQGAVLSQDPKVLEMYFHAQKKFTKFVETYPSQVEYQYSEGDVISFHNIRMVHGRTAITLNGGRRELQGCYSPLDEFRSRLRYLSIKLGKTLPKKIW